MALPKIGFNEGSLLRRTLIHVGTFVLGSMAFVGLMSFVLVSIAKAVASPSQGGPDEIATGTEAEAAPPPKSAKGGPKTSRKKLPVQAIEHPTNDD